MVLHPSGEDPGRRLRCGGGRGTAAAVFVGEDAWHRRRATGWSIEFHGNSTQVNHKLTN